jgi:diguanylate cyclase (GGDEF)-like protein
MDQSTTAPMSNPFPHLSTLLSQGRQSSDASDGDLHHMRVTGTLEYVASALTLITLITLPDDNHADHGAYAALAALAMVLAGLRWIAPKSVNTVKLSIALGIAFIGVIVAVSQPLGVTPLFFIAPIPTAGYFLGRRSLTGALMVFALTLAIALAVNPSVDNGLQIFSSTFATMAVVGALLVLLRERVDGLMRDLEHTASTDMLTGLVNRRTFETIMHREIERARRGDIPLSVALFDLDHFKMINDRFGHAEGDRALRRFADLLRSSCRLVDVPARIGGEEFALILSGSDAEGARIYAERLLHTVLEETKDDVAPISVSIGITEMSSPDDTLDILLLSADRALYEAKHRGRARVIVARPATPSQLEHTGERLEITERAADTRRAA